MNWICIIYKFRINRLERLTSNGLPSMSRSGSCVLIHPITTHAHKDAAGKALERAHHTTSPGASTAMWKCSAGPVQRRRECQTLGNRTRL